MVISGRLVIDVISVFKRCFEVNPAVGEGSTDTDTTDTRTNTVSSRRFFLGVSIREIALFSSKPRKTSIQREWHKAAAEKKEREKKQV